MERGETRTALQQMLGHLSSLMTQQYTKICYVMVRREVERLEAVG